MVQFTAIAAALSDASRVRALLALRKGELCVCQITALLRLAPSTVSKHMSVLKQAGLVLSRKRGRWIHYRLPGRVAPQLVRRALALMEAELGSSREARDNYRRLQKILTDPPGDMCRTPVGS